MDTKNIDWNHVTRFSQLVAIVLFVAVFFLGFWLGQQYEFHAFQNGLRATNENATPTMLGTKPIADVTYACAAGKTIRAIYRPQEVQLLLSDGRNLSVPQTISGSGARYANKDESFVFWNKGDTAFITEGNSTTFANCATKSIPQ